jgi:hypothetical protein
LRNLGFTTWLWSQQTVLVSRTYRFNLGGAPTLDQSFLKSRLWVKTHFWWKILTGRSIENELWILFDSVIFVNFRKWSHWLVPHSLHLQLGKKKFSHSRLTTIDFLWIKVESSFSRSLKLRSRTKVKHGSDEIKIRVWLTR